MQTILGGESAAQQDATASPQCGVYPQKLAAEENKLIDQRRSDLQLTEDDQKIGVALSGGGIRSATFSLGLFQSFARHDLLKRIDYLSTVSGGGYFGSFLGKLFVSAGNEKSPAEAADKVCETLVDTQSAPVNWLRQNGRYIAPKGSGDYFYAAGTYLRNWAAVQYVVGVTLLTIFLLANTLRGWAWHTWRGEKIEILVSSATLPYLWGSPWILIPVLIGALLLIPIGGAYWLTQRSQGVRIRALPRGVFFWNYPVLALLLVIFGAEAALFAIRLNVYPWLPQSTTALYVYGYVTAGGFLALVFYIAAGIKAPTTQVLAMFARNRLSRWLSDWLLIFLLIIIFVLIDSLGQTLYAISSAKAGPIALIGLFSSGLVLLARQFAGYLTKDPKKTPKAIRLPVDAIEFALGIVLALIVATFWAAVSHAILWKGEIPHADPGQQIVAYYAPSQPQVSLDSLNHIVVASPSNNIKSTAGNPPALEFVTVASLLAVLISLLTGKTMTFLNLSSIQEFYASRLSRAYLGASNPHRTGFGASPEENSLIPKPLCAGDVTRVIPLDDVLYDSYRPELNGGPIHLINVTINETIDGSSQLEQRDRKGIGMVVGPCGISAGHDHHACWSGEEINRQREIQSFSPGQGRFCIFNTVPAHVESLSLGQWVAISGAAFSTGLGARTNIGTSLLLGLSNVRIGYWWDSGISPRTRVESFSKQKPKISDWLEPLFSTQVYLSDEFLARFHGPRRQRWYLSDGGHFENTAAYELIRRRVPFIIVSDNGCDEDYIFDDLANMIRKARIDFDAEICFLEEGELNALLDQDLRKIIGTPAELQRKISESPTPQGNERFSQQAFSSCHALLARVYYDRSEVPGSLMLIIKPSLTGDEPLDLIEYFSQHPQFPQESTLDQFFDEAQWESYRKLGSYIGDRLLREIPSIEKFVENILEGTNY